MTLYETIIAIAKTTGNNEKIEMLKEADNKFPVFRDVLQYTYHPLWVYGIKKYNAPKSVGDFTIEEDWKIIEDTLNDLRDRVVTGKRAIDALVSTMSMFDEQSQELIHRVISRDLKAGFSTKFINTAIPNLIETFDVALAVELKKVKKGHVVLDGKTFFGSRKMDGLRCLAIKRGENVTFLTRTGREIFTLQKLRESILRAFKGIDCVLDGEVAIVDDEGVEDFQAISSEYNVKNHVIENPKYLMFDFLTLAQFFKTTEEPSAVFIDRIKKLESILEGVDEKTLSILPQYGLDEDMFEALKDLSATHGWEGVMLRQNIPYKSGRSNALIKHKLFQEDEFEVIDVEIDNFTAKVKGQGQVTYEGVVKRLVIEHKGTRVGVGSGLTIAQRIEWAERPELIIGNEITVKYQETTKNKQNTESLRFGTLKAVHNGKRDN